MDGSPVTASTPPLTSQQANAMQVAKLRADYAPTVAAACKGATLSDPAWASLLSLCWNIGPGAFARSGIGALVARGNLPAAAALLRSYNKAGRPLKVLPGLVTRRAAEASMLLGKPVAASVPAPARMQESILHSGAPPAETLSEADRLNQRELDRIHAGG